MVVFIIGPTLFYSVASTESGFNVLSINKNVHLRIYVLLEGSYSCCVEGLLSNGRTYLKQAMPTVIPLKKTHRCALHRVQKNTVHSKILFLRKVFLHPMIRNCFWSFEQHTTQFQLIESITFIKCYDDGKMRHS